MFLCAKCKSRLCPDCREIEAEYEQLLENYKRQNATLSAQIENVNDRLAAAEGRARTFESVAKMGYPEVITKWMDGLATRGD